MKFGVNIFYLATLASLVGKAKAETELIYASPDHAIKDKWIVKIKTPKTTEGFSASNRNLKGDPVLSAAEMNSLASTYHANVEETYQNSIHGFTAVMTEKDAKLMAQDPTVQYIEQDATISLDAVESWGLDRVDQRDLPLDQSYSSVFSGDGTGVTAYIIDTGILTTHNDFGGRAVHGINTAGDGQDTDCNGHGTHVAGTVGGTSYGLAKGVTLVGVKVLSCSGSGSTSGVIAGIEWAMDDAVNNGKTATANLSLGGGASDAIDEAVKNLHNAGVPTVVAAGNSAANACNFSPAKEPVVITVGSTTSTDGRSSFSNYGTCVDIFAPGSSITSAWIGNNAATNTISGTSMAAPHVCGAAALMLSSGVPAPDVELLLDDMATLGKVTNAGSGSPNKLLFVGDEGPTPNPTPAPPTPAPTPCIASTIKVSIKTDNWPTETGWTLVNNCSNENEIVVPAGTYTDTGTLYEEEYCVPDAEYTFRITDLFGDGNCCDYGDGSYHVTHNGKLVASGGRFEQADDSTFASCVPDTPTPPAPVTPAPVTPAPIATPAPVSPAPVTPAPVTPAPVTPAPTEPDLTTIFYHDYEDASIFSDYKPSNIPSRGMHQDSPAGLDREDGGMSVMIKKKEKLIYKPNNINYDAAPTVKFSFDAYGVGYSGNQGFKLQIKYKSTDSWILVKRWKANASGNSNKAHNGWYFYEKEISTEGGTGQFKWRLVGVGNSNAQKVYLGNMRITYETSTAGSMVIHTPAPVETPTGTLENPILIYKDNFEDPTTYTQYNPDDFASRVVPNPNGNGSMTLSLNKAKSAVMKNYKSVSAFSNVVFKLNVWAENHSAEEGLKLEIQFKDSGWETVKTWTVGESDLTIGQWTPLSHVISVTGAELRYRFKGLGDTADDTIYIDSYEVGGF